MDGDEEETVMAKLPVARRQPYATKTILRAEDPVRVKMVETPPWSEAEPADGANCKSTSLSKSDGRPPAKAKPGIHPVEKEHLVPDQHQESAVSEPSGNPIGAVSELPPVKTENAIRGEVLDRHSLKEALQILGLSLAEFSMLADTPLDTVKKWSSGKTKTPGIALAIVKLLAQMR
jgi:DNA-binding transcriptional regulator YiaG